MFARSVSLCVLLFGGVAVRGSVVFSDNFSYSDGPLQSVSAQRWVGHSGTTNQVFVEKGVVKLSGSKSQDVNALLNGQPYVSSSESSPVLYASWTIKFSTLPSSSGSYFAHFKDSTGGFRARVWALQNGANTGNFRLGISSSSGSAPAKIRETDLQLDKVYRVVIRLDVSTSVAKLWIDPATEADPSVETDSGTAIPIAAFALRQATGIGNLEFDDLVVGTRFADVVPVPSAPVSDVVQGPGPAPSSPMEPSPTSDPPSLEAPPVAPDPVTGSESTPTPSTPTEPIAPAESGQQAAAEEPVMPSPVTLPPLETAPTNNNGAPGPDDVPSAPVAPMIKVVPTAATISVGESLVLNAEASGREPLSFQWSFNGQAISGATNPTLELSKVTPEHQGEYRVFVENPFGTARSSAIDVIVVIPPVQSRIQLRLDLSATSEPILKWTAEPYRSYSVHYSENPSGPFWSLATGLKFSDEQGRFLDNQVGRGSVRFYHISAP